MAKKPEPEKKPNNRKVKTSAAQGDKRARTLREASAIGRKRLADAAAAKSPPVEDDVGGELPASMVSNGLWRQLAHKRAYKKRMVEGPDELWEIACEYFQWVEENPLYEGKIFSTPRGIRKAALPKMRAMTIEGLCTFLGISYDTWMKWKRPETHPDLAACCNLINYIIREQKFTGAAADLLNAMIVSRDLGLADKQEHSGPEGGPIEVSAKEILAERLGRLAKARENAENDPEPS